MFRIVLVLLIVIPFFIPWRWMQFATSLLAFLSLLLLIRLEKLEREIKEQKIPEHRQKERTTSFSAPPQPSPATPPPASFAERMGTNPVVLQKEHAVDIPESLPAPAGIKKETFEREASVLPSEESSRMAQKAPDATEKEPVPQSFIVQKESFSEDSSLHPSEKTDLLPLPPDFKALVLNWLKNGNPVVKAGLVILLFGISFLLKYAVQHAMFPPEFRVALAGLFGIILLGIGWRLRMGRRTFALLMQGGGIATLYLTAFAAAKPDSFPMGLGMISTEWGLGLMTAIVVFSAILAVLQNALWVAIFGWAGGFMAPILLSTGSNRYIALFSYYALLNTGLLGVAWFKNWRFLNLLGFTFTFGIGSLWGFRLYKPEFFTTTEPFLILFSLMYAVISILFARSGVDGKKEARLDSVLVFGLPLVAFGLQMGLVREMEMGGAYSCLVLSAWYLVTAKFLWKGDKSLGLLAESHLGLGIIFFSLAIPMALDATATASTWALEGAGMVWLGLRQKRILSRLFGVLLQIGAALSFLFVVAWKHDGDVLGTGQLLAGLFLGMGGFISSWAYWTFKENIRDEEHSMYLVCGIWGFLFWYPVWRSWLVNLKIPSPQFLILCVFTLSHLAWFGVYRKTKWPLPRYALQGFLILLFLFLFSWPEHPLGQGGWRIWPLSLALHFVVLYLREKEWNEPLVGFLHTGNILLLSVLFMWEIWWFTNSFVETWIWAHTARAVTGGFILLVISSPPPVLSWPLKTHEYACMRGGTVIAIFLVVWWILSCFKAGGQEPLPYLPILNVLDLGQALVIVLLASWTLKAERIRLFNIEKIKTFFAAGLAAAIFIWLNVVVTRIAHFWGDIPYQAEALFRSEGLQAVYSVLWTSMAFMSMAYSHRRMRREIWFVGAGLLALVVAKLFLVDLSGRGTIAGIVSFIGVGILMLVVGYFCPLPPRREQVQKNLFS